MAVVFQAQRADVHTVVVNGNVVKSDHRLVGSDIGEPGGSSRRRSSTLGVLGGCMA
jgi:hypothetical protein